MRRLDVWTFRRPDRRLDVQTSERPDIRTSGRADVRTSRRRDVWTSRRPDVGTSGHPDVLTCGRLDVNESEETFETNTDSAQWQNKEILHVAKEKKQ